MSKIKESATLRASRIKKERLKNNLQDKFNAQNDNTDSKSGDFMTDLAFGPLNLSLLLAKNKGMVPVSVQVIMNSTNDKTGNCKIQIVYKNTKNSLFKSIIDCISLYVS